jgi:transcriptional regulator with XRE-family HTH domain
LRKGRIENPGYEKLNAIARVMGFSRELWFDNHFDPHARVIAKSAE